ncbi:hypothetical protein [Streptomyces sp. SID4982]|uniref:hypothetical protein n=1 Tax=Streptomyces sp. SID4982 TaxID=2690291 RepID=UPI00136F651E|nr:hypothetical protein [Streptomyces sp. SID4982]MYS16676.1 hypothetical protein [Streptomyces sp. SID4982]
MSMKSQHGRSVDPEELLLRTDWSSVEHCCPNVAPTTPAILRQLLDEDASKQGIALRDLREAVTHSNTFYSATAPAASFVAAILGHPQTLAEVTDQRPWEVSDAGEQPRFPLRVGLLNWLGSTAWDANEESAAGYAKDVEAFHGLRQSLYAAVQPFFTDADPDIRDAALAAALPLLASPELAHHAEGLRAHVRGLAADSDPHRRRAMDALASWGEDITPFQQHGHSPAQVPLHTQGFADDPPF